MSTTLTLARAIEHIPYALLSEFTLEAAGSDERLHLIAIEQTPSVGTSPDGKSISLRINNESRTLHGWEAVPVGIGDDFKIFPMGDGGVESGGTSGGCIAGPVHARLKSGGRNSIMF